jgi:CheY-like chemotaxis protein
MAEILWVENDAEFQQLLTRKLKKAGHSITECADRQTAIEILKNNPLKFDIVVTDIHLTHKDPNGGRELTKQINEWKIQRGYDPAPLVLCITNYYVDANTQFEVEQEGGRYVSKDTNTKEYLRNIDLLLLELDKLRGQGPLFRIAHKYAPDTMGRACYVGEEVASVELLYRNSVFPVMLTRKPRRIFDYLARYALTRPQTTIEIIKGLTEGNAFYHEWFAGKDVSPDSIKMDVRRIRKALGETFQQAHLNLDPNSVLVSHAKSSDPDDDWDGDEDDVSVESNEEAKEKGPPKAYKLSARIALIHEG